MSAGGGAKTAVPARIAPFHTAAMSSELIERMHCICDLHSPDKWQRRWRRQRRQWLRVQAAGGGRCSSELPLVSGLLLQLASCTAAQTAPGADRPC